MSYRILISSILATVMAAPGCTLWHRTPEAYRDNVVELVETEEQEAALVTCYEKALDEDRTLKGTVVVKYTVAQKTGELKDVQVVAEKTTAPESLHPCALALFEGLKLEEGDLSDGLGEYALVFKPGRDRPRPENEEPAPAPAANPAPAPNPAPAANPAPAPAANPAPAPAPNPAPAPAANPAPAPAANPAPAKPDK